MRVAILGSPFDPPHNGHLLMAKQTIDFGPRLDEVWLMPDFAHPWRKQIASARERLRMAGFLTSDKVRLSDLAIKKGGISFTIDIVRELREKFSHHFFWLIGSDTLKSFDKWKEAKNLLKEIPFLVFNRLDYPVRKSPPGFILINSPLLVCTDISSSKVRERVRRGLSISGMVPENVEKYIKEHKLYF